MRSRFTRFFRYLLILCLLLAGWILFDLYQPQKVDLRNFDPVEVARLDTAMWKSYYKKDRAQLYAELTELLEIQYQLSFWKKQQVAWYAGSAAFVFKKGRSRKDYEKALPDLTKFFERIHALSLTDFDAAEAARLELEWWIIHRERNKRKPGELARALAEAVAELYQMPVDKFTDYGDFRARAMGIRDQKSKAGGVTEEDWENIETLLNQSWRSLHDAVNQS
ncbi:MAG: hypothetical protein P1U89_20030 [Verrucomicrobiales bacterium]|nr:hypothetical protein [Verrucomicrobiales bacterium]